MSAYTHAKELLTRVVPWPQNGEGYVNLHYRTVGANGGMFWNGAVMTSPSEIEKQLTRIMAYASTRDMYFCTSMQKNCKEAERNGPNGKWMAKDAERSQEGVVSLKSLFVDLDVKPGAYADTKEALKALFAFCDEIKLPRPQVIVASGTGGAHCYWVMCDPLSRAEWQLLAKALAKALKDRGVKFDAGCTIDSARVLRVPDTFNYKQTPPLPTKLLLNKEGDYLVETIRKALDEYVEADPYAHLRTGKSIAPLPEMVAGISEGKHDPVALDTLQCPFIVEALATGGAAFNNPLWMLTSLAAVFSTGGRADAHRMANRHPTYTPAETDAMYDRKVRDHEDKGIGWPTCSSISNDYAGCKGCAFRTTTPLHTTKVTAPPPVVNLVAPPVPQKLTMNDLPDGYRRDANGYIEAETVKDDGTTTYRTITSFTIDTVWAQKDPWIMHFTANLDGKPQSCQMPWEATATMDGVPKVLSKQGLSIRANLIKDIRELFVSWMQKLRDTKDAIVTSSPFGWVANQNGKIDGFSYAGQVWMAGGMTRSAASPDTVLMKAYEPMGDPQVWINAAKMTTDQRRPDLDTILASAFAGPLVRFTGRDGVIIAGYSTESGIGKTTTMKIAQSVWGHPKKGMQGLSDTQNSAIKKLGMLKHLPFYWDELKTELQIKTFTQFAFQVAEGQEKARLDRSSALREQGDWQTLCVVASNDSLMDAVTRATSTTTAGIVRVFEFPIRPRTQGKITNSDASRMVDALTLNHGQIGLMYAKFLGDNIARIDNDIEKLSSEIEAEVSGLEEERYWLSAITTTLQGAIYANELGFTDIDIDALKGHLIGTLAALRGDRQSRSVDISKTINVMDILSRYMRDMKPRHCLFTDTMHVGVGKPKPNSVKIINDVTRMDTVLMHISQKPAVLRMDSHSFSDWLMKQNYSRQVVSKALEKEFSMRKVNGKMGAGTPASTPTMHLLEIDLTGTAIASMVDF